MIVHFPIALILFGFLAEVLSHILKKENWLIKAAFWLMMAGTLAAIMGYLTGEYFTQELTGEAGELKEKHELFAKITMYVMIAASAFRLWLLYSHKSETNLKWIVFTLFLVAATTIGIVGFLGGSLVYNYMIGI